jgi:uncharacterized DUF497 family protein
MRFEYDQEKSAANKRRHGIDFDRAQTIWDDPERVEISARGLDKPRYLVIGKIDGGHWSAVMTYGNESIRLISVRRSRKEEMEHYEGF